MDRKIQISVADPEYNTDANIPYVSYLVSGEDGKGPFSMRRRYRDFHLLREKLVQRWPGLYIPPISSKKVAGNTEEKFVQLRKKFLNYFCEKIAQREYLFMSDVFQIFIRGTGEFEKAAKELDRLDYEALSAVYEKNFTELTQNYSSAELQLRTENDYAFMKSAEKKLERVREDMKALSTAKMDYQKQFSHVMSNCLPEFEQKFLLKYVEDDRSKLFLNSSDEFAKQLKQYEEYTYDNALEDYSELISYELREMRAFVEAIDSRKRAEVETKQKLEAKRRQSKQQAEKLRSGRTTFKSIFSTGSKQNLVKELEETITKCEKQEQCLGNMIFLMNAAICHELAEYKDRRKNEYSRDIERINKKQIKEMTVLGGLLEIPLAHKA